MGQANQQLSDALKRLSAAKYGRPRGQVEQEIFKRLSVQKVVPAKGPTVPRPGGAAGAMPKPGGSAGSSFLDEWLAKRKQIAGSGSPSRPGVPASTSISPPVPQFRAQVPPAPLAGGGMMPSPDPSINSPAADPVPAVSTNDSVRPEAQSAPAASDPEHFNLRGSDDAASGEVSIKLR